VYYPILNEQKFSWHVWEQNTGSMFATIILSLPSCPPQKIAGSIHKAIIFVFFRGRELGFPLEQKKGN
jgi:hypothetical protein